MPKFSIVIPVYNTHQYVEECLRSVSQQTFSDYEIIVVDDGSTDTSLSICETFRETHREIAIAVVTQNNSGLLQARRKGFSYCSGDYVVCLDSDDTLFVNALNAIDDVCRRTRADVIAYNCSRDCDDRTKYYSNVLCGLFAGSDKKTVYEALFNPPTNLGNMCLKAFKRELLSSCMDYSKIGRIQFGEDFLQSAELIDLSNTIVCIDEPLYFYRPNDKSIANTFKRSRYEDVKAVHSRVMKYAVKWDQMNGDSRYIQQMAQIDLLSIYRQLEAAAIGDSDFKEFLSYVRNDSFCRATLTRADCSMLPRAHQRTIMYQFKLGKLSACEKLLRAFVSARKVARFAIGR